MKASTMKNFKHCAVTVAILLSLIGCSSEPKKTAETKPAEAKPAFQPTFLTGREALQKMYISARAWTGDVKPFNLQSMATKDANGQDGKSGVWSCGFASPSRRGLKAFTWSGIKADDAPEPGVSSRPEDTYNANNTSTQIFEIGFLKVDSDKALEEANKHGGDKLLKKEPDTKVFYLADWNGRENKLTWHILYGPDRDNPKLRIAVDATTGTFIKVER